MEQTLTTESVWLEDGLLFFFLPMGNWWYTGGQDPPVWDELT